MKMYLLQKDGAFSSYIAMDVTWRSAGYSELANPGANNGGMEKYLGKLDVFMGTQGYLEDHPSW